MIERIKEIRKCSKCDNTFELEGTYSELNNKKSRKTCSLKCSKSTPKTEEQKKQISIIMKNSTKVKENNKTLALKRIGKYKIERTETPCLHCNVPIIHKVNEPKKYHKKCWLKCCGGIQHGSSRGKCGWYKGYWCDSSYELAFILYCLDFNIKVERNTIGYDYLDLNNKNKKYYPDFIINNKYFLEIKNYVSKETTNKINQFEFSLKTLYKNDLNKKILPYVINKYGKKYISLYDNYKEKIKEKKNNCLYCNNKCYKKYCNYECSGNSRKNIKKPHTFLSFSEAKNIIKNFNISSNRKYIEFIKQNKQLNIPIVPKVVYKDEWINWNDWLNKIS